MRKKDLIECLSRYRRITLVMLLSLVMSLVSINPAFFSYADGEDNGEMNGQTSEMIDNEKSQESEEPVINGAAPVYEEPAVKKEETHEKEEPEIKNDADTEIKKEVKGPNNNSGDIPNVNDSYKVSSIPPALRGPKVDVDVPDVNLEGPDSSVTITIRGASKEVIYDGTEYSAAFTYTVTEKIGDKTLNVDNPGISVSFKNQREIRGTDAGTYQLTLKPEDVEVTNNNGVPYKNCTIEIVDGVCLSILPRNVVLTSATAEKVYDGTALTRNRQTDITVDGGFVEGEGATCEITGSQTNVGSSKNTFTYILNEGTKAGNYIITKVEGDLTVTPASVAIQSLKTDDEPAVPGGYDPEPKKTSDASYGSKADSSGVKTGDGNGLMLYVSLMTAASVSMILVYRRRRSQVKSKTK